MSYPASDLILRIERLERRISREKGAREQAELLLEQKSQELYEINSRLVALNGELEEKVSRRTSELERERKAAIAMSERDVLTSLANRARFQAHVENVIEGCTQSGRQAALLLVDLDRFKQVNDHHGHAVGDALLLRVADLLQACVPEDGLVARLGGDEFALVIESDVAALAVATSLAARIGTALNRVLWLDGVDVRTSCSIGIAAVPEHASGREDLMRHADLALYAAKTAGRSRPQVFSPDLLAAFEDQHQLEQDLRAAVEDGSIDVWFQPIVSTKTGRIVAVETLARWQHSERGMVPPARFIAIAEERGLIGELGRQMITKACLKMAPLLKHTGLNYVAVNLSPLQLQDASLAGYIGGVLKQADMPSSSLLLEVTESVMLTDNPQVRLTLEALRTSGVLLALDDFGAGYSNLSSLVQLRVNLLKIDRTFIRDLEGSLSTGIMIRSITALAHELGIEVVIEGVETEEQRALIASYGCDFAQGYLFCRPLPLENFKAMIVLAESDVSPPPAARAMPARTSAGRASGA